jgi:hypothetical protein
MGWPEGFAALGGFGGFGGFLPPAGGFLWLWALGPFLWNAGLLALFFGFGSYGPAFNF